MKDLRYYLLIVLTIGIVASGQSQEETIHLQLDPIGVTEGLSSNVVTALYEDKYGFIWAGTYDGLNRLDGYNVEIFREEFYKNPFCHTNRIYRLVSHIDGQLWISKDEGAYLWDIVADSIVYSMAKSPNPARYVGTLEDGSTLLTNNKAELISIHPDNEKSFRKRVPYPKDKDGILPYTINGNQISVNQLGLVNNLGGIMIYDGGTGVFKYRPPQEDYGKAFKISGVDGLGRIWAGGEEGALICYDPMMDKYVDIGSELHCPHDIMSFYHDEAQNQMWVCTKDGGAYTYDYNDHSWSHYDIRVKNINMLHPVTIMSMIRDRHGVLWFGTSFHGILTYDAGIKKFESLNTEKYGLPIAMKHPRHMVEDSDKNIWIGTSSQGLWKYNPNSDSIQILTKQSRPDLMYNNSVTALWVDDKDLYVGHDRGGISVINRSNMRLCERLTFQSQSPFIKNNNSIREIYIDSLGRRWVGTIFAGLFMDDGSKVTHLFKDEKYLTTNRDIHTITTFLNGDIVICNRIGGLYKWNENSKTISRLYPKNEEDQLAIKSVYQDQSGDIWLATDGKGVHVLNSEYQIKDILNVQNGIVGSDVICSIMEDHQSNIWISTNNGLTSINGWGADSNWTSHIYTMANGLRANEFMTGTVLKTEDKMWIGTIDGINYWNHQSIQLCTNHLPSYISRIEINNEAVVEGGNQFLVDEVTLQPQDYSISIDFNTIGFTLPDLTKYRYRLLGLDDTWSTPSTRTYASYGFLEPKEYTFELQASNYDGVWSNDIRQLKINVLPQYYESGWFKMLLALSGVSLLFLINQYMVRQARLQEEVKNKYEKELSQMEMRALRAQINPHFLFNTLNSINNYILQNNDEFASSYLVKFSKLMRKILSNSALPFITISEEVDTMDLYIEMESMRFAQSFDYFIHVDKDVNAQTSYIPPMLMQPFVENAIWHGLMHSKDEKCLQIRISKYTHEILELSVKDNGIGREAARSISGNGVKKRSYGMDITQKRIDLLNRQYRSSGRISNIKVVDMTVESHGHYGTEIIIHIPIITSDAKILAK